MRRMTRAGGFRFRQSQQGERAVGFDFEQPADQCPSLTWRQPPIEHEKPHETERIGMEIGGDDGGAVHDLGGGKLAWLEQRTPVITAWPLRQKMQISGDKQGPRLRQQTHEARKFAGSRSERQLPHAAPARLGCLLRKLPGTPGSWNVASRSPCGAPDIAFVDKDRAGTARA
jgi:hypothetical protein